MPANPAVGTGRLPGSGQTGKRKRKRKRGHRPATETGAEVIARKERVGRIIDWRLQGYTLKEIGEWENLSFQRVHDIISEHLKKVADDQVGDLRKLESMRMDQMLTGLLPLAARGDFDAAQAVVRIMERRAKMLGIDEPEKIQTEEVGRLAEAKTSLLGKLDQIAERMKQREVAMAALAAPTAPADSDMKIIDGTAVLVDAKPADPSGRPGEAERG